MPDPDAGVLGPLALDRGDRDVVKVPPTPTRAADEIRERFPDGGYFGDLISERQGPHVSETVGKHQSTDFGTGTLVGPPAVGFLFLRGDHTVSRLRPPCPRSSVDVPAPR